MADHRSLLQNWFLFHDFAPQEMDELLHQMPPEVCSFRRGDVLCTQGNSPQALFLLLEGACDVVHRKGEEQVLLNTLSVGDTFGVLSLFSKADGFPSTVIARQETTVARFDKAHVLEMMQGHPQISLNLLTFLTDRVEFLNARLLDVTEPNVEKKVARFLLRQSEAHGHAPFPVNRVKMAEALSCGRASLYRVLEELIQAGLIETEGKQINVICPEGLERILLS